MLLDVMNFGLLPKDFPFTDSTDSLVAEVNNLSFKPTKGATRVLHLKRMQRLQHPI